MKQITSTQYEHKTDDTHTKDDPCYCCGSTKIFVKRRSCDMYENKPVLYNVKCYACNSKKEFIVYEIQGETMNPNTFTKAQRDQKMACPYCNQDRYGLEAVDGVNQYRYRCTRCDYMPGGTE